MPAPCRSLEVACQVCGAGAATPVYERAFDSLALGRVRVRLVLCDACGFLYQSPRPDPDALRAHYAESAFASGAVWRELGPGSRHERMVGQRARFVERALAGRARGRLLDVGCARGDFLAALALPGWERVGLEPGAAPAAAARARGLTVVEAALEDGSLAPGSFDAVTCFSVLEHVWDAGLAMRALARLVAPGGALVLYVPDTLRARAQVAEFFAFEHLSHFTRGTLARLVQAAGLAPGALEEAEGPGLLLAARASADARALPPPPDERALLAQAVARYAAERERFEGALRARFAPLLARWERDGARLAIFGAGEHTRFLFDLLPLRERCVALLDGDPAKRGRRVLGLPVHAPEELAALGVDAVVLSSEPFQEEMAARLAPLAEPAGVALVRCYPAPSARAASDHGGAAPQRGTARTG